jgi:DUF4097 and DUF4098 domain-containing protein YvlB
MHRFATPTPPRLLVEFRAGSILVETADVAETTVDLRDRNGGDSSGAVAATVIEQRGRDIVVLVPDRLRRLFNTPQLDLHVVAPLATELDLRSGSATITARGTFGTTSITSGSGVVAIETIEDSARVRTGSGYVRIDTVTGDLQLRSGSGGMEIGSVEGSIDAQTGSGDLRLGHGGAALRVKSGSGDVSVGDAPEDVRATTGSGDVRIETAARGDVHVRAASGDLHVGVPSGTAAWVDVRTISGRLSSELESAVGPQGDDERVRLRLETASGDIELVRV